ncbi:PITH domain-containing protein [Triangularia verruculosa]|uniref:PITH domain-containing protein n=1 Tax=Triangularia verruculosa TaxID=2587418 RepID=A0AAN6XGH0_9PEZI|nr:PITH domain-containing protein [Triangularia verruculosa]
MSSTHDDKPIEVTSPTQFQAILQTNPQVVADCKFYADWCGPCKAIKPIFEKASAELSHENVLIFIKINTDKQKDIAQAYNVTALPSFLYFRNGELASRVTGADMPKLSVLLETIRNDFQEAVAKSGGASSGSGQTWRGAALPRGYTDITDQVEINRSELLNYDSGAGNVRTLLDSSRPSALSGTKSATKDWVESDTDEQLMLFLPFQGMLKLHTLQITSLPPSDDDEDEVPARPKTIKLFSNKPHNLGFDEAEDMSATQAIELSEKDWNSEGTANISLRYVKFQNINSLVLFVVDGDGDSEKVRLDRLRLIGEAGEKREMGKLEKIGDE